MNVRILVCFISAVLFFSCSDNRQHQQVVKKTGKRSLPKDKPSSAFPDTLKINSIAAVFYSPDSLQLQKIRSGTDSAAFEAIIHEYDYLSGTARSILKKDFPEIQIIEARNVRYLLFITPGKKESYIDLDKNYDPYGLYVFDRQKAPQLVDMANTETALGFYFSR